MAEDDVFTLPEYEESDCESINNDVIEVNSDSDELKDILIPGTDDDVIGLNSTLVSEINSNYCESVTSCSTGILTDTDHERQNRQVIHLDESSDDEDIFFGKENNKRKRSNSDEDDTQSGSNDIVISSKGSGKVQKRPKPVLFAEEELSLKCEWMTGEEICNFPLTRNKYDFAHHVKSHTEHMKFLEDGTYQCQWKGCLKIFSAHFVVFHVYFHAYHTALKSIGENCAKRDKLKTCSFPTHRVNSFKVKDANRVCMWNNCKQSFVNMFAYEIHIDHHMEKFHSKADQHVRLPCEWKNCIPRQTAQRKAMMIRHLLKHTQLKQVACPTCGDLFKTRAAFKTHCQRLKKDVDLQCNLCKKFFSTETLLHNHVQKHVYTKKCPICQAMCLSASTLATHIRYKHLDEEYHMFKCNKCDFKTISNYQLITHKKTHLPKEMRPKLSCEFPGCQYSCLIRRTMYDHIKSKHESAKYICHVCSKEYLTSTTLSRHLRKKHSLTFPVGTDRFRFRKDKEGNYRLQTVRYEMLDNEEEVRPYQTQAASSEIPRYNLRILGNRNGGTGVEVVLEQEGELVLGE